MTRGVGVAEWIATLPEWVVALAALLTQLADLWFLVLVVGTAYWLGPHVPRAGSAIDRRRMAAVVAALVLAMVSTYTLKAVFALPRPPWFVAEPTIEGVPAALDPLVAWLGGADGYGFPSGHAIAATVGWGGLAWAIRVGHARHRLAVAAAVVAVVSLARLALGLHYLVDVLAGLVLGLCVLGLVLGPRRGATIGFGLATVTAVVGLALAGLHPEAAAAAGLAFGTAAGWFLLGERAVAVAGRRSALLAAAVGVLGCLPVLAAVVAGALGAVPTLVVATVVGVVIIALPLGGNVLEKTG